MLNVCQALAHLARGEHISLVVGSTFVGGSPSNPNKLRLRLADGSFLTFGSHRMVTTPIIGNAAVNGAECTGGIMPHTLHA
jgi:hypothetical protein